MEIAAVVLGVAVAASAFAQTPTAPTPSRPAVYQQPREGAPPRDSGPHKMEIYNGPYRTVSYLSGSPREQATLNDLGRAENEMSYLDNLDALRRQYVADERTLEPRRSYVQGELYSGLLSLYNGYDALAGYGYGPGDAYGPFYAYYNYPYGYGYGYPYGYGAYGWTPALGGAPSGSVTPNLGYGMGDEGRLKDAFAPVIAQQAASPEYRQSVARAYAAALNQVDDSIRKPLKIPPKSETRPPVPDEAARAKGTTMLTLKNGEKIEGKMTEDGDWYVVDTGKMKTRIRKSEVVRMDEMK
jgi:hypothetical protein